MELTFEVVLDPNLVGVVPNAVSFETGATPNQVGPLVYEHHGEGFERAPGALTAFYEDLVSGLPLPLKFAMRRVGGVDAVVAAALFLHRDLVLQPRALELIAAVDLVHRKGINFSGHVDADLAGFFRAVEQFFRPELSKEEVGERLRSSVGWVREYLVDQRLPNLGLPPPVPTILDIGSEGFVLAATETTPQIDSWFDLYRQGFLRGVLVGPDVADGMRQVIASKKCGNIPFDLNRACNVLNNLEELSGGPPVWHMEDSFLFSPPEGTAIQLSHLVAVFLRI